MPHQPLFEKTLYQERRQELCRLLQQTYPAQASTASIVLFANFEQDCIPFRQESSFYYLTGIEEPGIALMINVASGDSTLYIPDFGATRSNWVASAINKGQQGIYGIATITYLGNPCTGYQSHSFFTEHEYAHLIHFLQSQLADKKSLFTIYPTQGSGYLVQRCIMTRLNTMITDLIQHSIDIAPIIASMRRTKDQGEIELIYQAIEVTMDAHDAAARLIKPGAIEYEVQAGIEFTFTDAGCSTAFPSIVASGKQATILHYCNNDQIIAQGELVVVDIGASYAYYAADITRTYPASGVFSARQRELYQLVLDTQEYIAAIAKPGMWLSNKDKQEQSLHHCAVAFLKERGYDKYFIHGIGHFMGIDVHDVGDASQPLKPGDVFTIEPGLYIKEENIGIRIEDNYWMVEDGVVCLSQALPKQINEIEQMVQQVILDNETDQDEQ